MDESKERKYLGFAVHEDIYKKQFLIKLLLEEDDLDFDIWYKARALPKYSC